ncbi:hypothetical protein ACFPAF_08785 [Hymenobacter endophyticus]|uniref:AMP-dependent synthetase/ligase domain-containing protein n=1 Tax=Hymenobacter endophyticus TaxID=3076335 RepID=A0ABU3TGL2_9BACT|nr:hypothetical protein [Hymenobacter endophyticus]MDU0370483.1 hypothetical protein [Hymenobacter endophyticus]
MKEKLLFEVVESFSLTGLGVLLLPANPTLELQNLALHTALKVQLRFPGGRQIAAVASVEEISRPQQAELGALLLTQEGAEPIPAGTEVWWNGQEATWEELL